MNYKYRWDDCLKDKYKETLVTDLEISEVIKETLDYLDAGLVRPSGNKIQEIFQIASKKCLKFVQTRKCLNDRKKEKMV